MSNEQNKTVVWTVVIGVVLALIMIGGLMMVNTNVNTAADKATQASADAKSAKDSANNAVALASQIPSAPAIDNAAIAKAVADELAAQTAQIIDTGSSGAMSVNGEYTCRNIYYPNPNAYVNFVVTKLDENGYRKLFSEIGDSMNIGSKSDITSALTHEIGQCKTNQDPSRGLTANRVTTQQFTMDVKFYKDGNTGDLYQKRFLVTAQISNMGDMLSNGDLNLLSVTPVSNNYVLP